MRISDEKIEEILRANNILDVVGSYVSLTKKGDSHFGLCPFHQEKTPSFSVSERKQIFYCFGCHKGGNVIHFLQEYENLTYLEACKALAERAGIDLKMEYSPAVMQKRQKADGILNVNGEMARLFVKALNTEEGKRAKDYFHERGLDDASIKRFGLGYCSKRGLELYRELKEKGLSEEDIRNSALFTFKENDVYCKFYNRAMFPIIDKNKRVIGFGGRVMGEGEPKYLNSIENEVFEKRKNLYGLNLALKSRSKYYLLCEGYMDVISLQKSGFEMAVASLGTALTVEQARLIKRYVESAYITYDMDGAGRKSAYRAVPILRNAGLKVKVVDMSPYKDPDEFINNLGPSEYEKRVENAKNGIYFMADYLLGQIIESDKPDTTPGKLLNNIKDPDDVVKYEKSVAEIIFEHIKDPDEREAYKKSLAEYCGISIDSLDRNIKILATEDKRREPSKRAIESEYERNVKRKKESNELEGHRMLITYLSEHPEHLDIITKYISPNDLSDDLFIKVFTILCEQIRTENAVRPDLIVDRFAESEDRYKVNEMFTKTFPETFTKTELEQSLTEIIRKIKTDSLKKFQNEAKTANDIAKFMKIQNKMKEAQKIDIHF